MEIFFYQPSAGLSTNFLEEFKKKKWKITIIIKRKTVFQYNPLGNKKEI